MKFDVGDEVVVKATESQFANVFLSGREATYNNKQGRVLSAEVVNEWRDGIHQITYNVLLPDNLKLYFTEDMLVKSEPDESELEIFKKKIIETATSFKQEYDDDICSNFLDGFLDKVGLLPTTITAKVYDNDLDIIKDFLVEKGIEFAVTKDSDY